ncbi:hypothetical protein EVD19_07935 [Elizabethkingia meningoseptica]|nr:hypothetical protein EVD19_07935 [Elizabethkingia meningoseptica]
MTNEEIIFEYEDYSTETSNDIQTIYHTHPFYNYEMKYPSKISNIDSQCYIETNSNVGSNDNSGRLYIRRLNVKRLKGLYTEEDQLNLIMIFQDKISLMEKHSLV